MSSVPWFSHEPASHQAPETGPVVATGGVVQVRQTEVVAVLVGEDAEATVLRLVV